MKLEDGIKNWPKGPDGEPERPVLVESGADFAAYAGILISMLEAFGIPVLTDRGDAEEAGFLYGGFSLAGVKLYVPESRLEEARALLEPDEDTGGESRE